jgi:hypothetical protein
VDTGGVSPDQGQLHPAEHRAYRELFVACRQLTDRWGRLASAVEGTAVAESLERGSAEVKVLLSELEPRIAVHGLHAGPAVQSVGARIAELRSAITDRGGDTGMVVRFAVLDIEHIATLLAQLAELADARGDTQQTSFCREWSQRLRPEVKGLRKAAVRLGRDPDRTAAPLDDSLLTRAAHGVGWVLGTVGEAVDRATAERRD